MDRSINYGTAASSQDIRLPIGYSGAIGGAASRMAPRASKGEIIMRGRKSQLPRTLHPGDKEALLALCRSKNASHMLVQHAKMVLAFHQGASISTIARALPMARQHVYAWLARYQQQGLAGLERKRSTKKL